MTRDNQNEAAPGTESLDDAGLPEDFNQTLGERVRMLRDGASLSLDALATRSGVSRAMLSKVERGEKSPTIGIATRIAQALGTSLSFLVGTEEPRSAVVVVPKRQRAIFRDSQTGFERHQLSPPIAGTAAELLYHFLPPGVSTGLLPPYPSGTEKYAVVIEGTLTLSLPHARHELAEGDAIFFEANVAHSFANDQATPCSYYLVVCRR